MTAPAPARWRCHACLAEHSAYAAAERHADAERHHRIEWVVS